MHDEPETKFIACANVFVVWYNIIHHVGVEFNNSLLNKLVGGMGWEPVCALVFRRSNGAPREKAIELLQRVVID